MSEIIQNLYLSCIVTAKDEKFMKINKITHILVAAKGLKQYFSGIIKYKTLNLTDTPGANISKYFIEAIQLIEEVVSSNQNILVHCRGGRSRTATLVIAYIMIKLKMSFEEALSYVQKRHERACPNEGFQRQLKEFEKCLNEYFLILKDQEEKNTNTIEIKLLDQCFKQTMYVK